MLQTRHPVEQLLRRGRGVRVVQQRLIELQRVNTETHLGTVGLRSEQNGRAVRRAHRLNLDQPVLGQLLDRLLQLGTKGIRDAILFPTPRLDAGLQAQTGVLRTIWPPSLRLGRQAIRAWKTGYPRKPSDADAPRRAGPQSTVGCRRCSYPPWPSTPPRGGAEMPPPSPGRQRPDRGPCPRLASR